MTEFVADTLGLSPEERANPYTATIHTMNECWAAGWSRDDTAEEVVSMLQAYFHPEHHAVYDTRTHVSVPIADIEDWIVAADECRVQKQWPVRGVPSEFHFPWLDESTEVAKLQGIETWLRSLLPKEEAND